MMPDLSPGEIYNIRWPDWHPNRQQVDPGYLGEFIEWRDLYCSTHGDKLAREALFRKVKPNGRRSYMFAVDPRGVTIKAVP